VGWLIVWALLALGPGGAAAQSPVAPEVHAWATRYHEDPARLDGLRSRMLEAARTDGSLDNLLALARISFIWGDVRAPNAEAKLEAYDQGRQAAQRATELAPRSALAHFWYGATTGRWGQTKGVMRSLFLLPSLKRAVETSLELDPRFPPAYALAGNVYYEVPAAVGGDLDRAEAMYRKGLQLSPRFTAMRVGLARVLIKKGRTAEARRELQAVVDEQAPENPADWTLKDVRHARDLLATLQGRS
jgi:tetratricopeptide (TPR) repeat protein